MKPARTALSLYVALALHLLVILLLALGSALPQLPEGAGMGLGEASAGRRHTAAEAQAYRASAIAPTQASKPLTLSAAPVQVKAPPGDPLPQVAGSGRAGGGRGGYLAELRRHLSRHRRSLPGRLAELRSDVAFTVEANGAVSDLRLHRSSGLASLDEEALALIRRAEPLPAPPQGRRLSLVVPVAVESRNP